MSHCHALLLLCLAVIGSCGYSVPPNAANPAPPAKAQSTPPADCISYAPDQFGDYIREDDIKFSDEGALSYQGYEIAKQVRKSKIDSSDYYADIEYAVLRKGRRVVARFDSDPGQDSEIRFALFRLLGTDTKQLIVEQTSNRFWRYWVLNLSPKLEVIYDSGDYDAIYSLKTADLDSDGKYELVQSLGTFWFFSVPDTGNMLSNVNSPRPDIVFKYDPDRRKYLPANPEFQSVMLKDINGRIEKAREINQRQPACFSTVLDVVLRYVYAGKEKDAWEFFEQEYQASDKEATESEIKKALKGDAIYRAIYKRGAT